MFVFFKLNTIMIIIWSFIVYLFNIDFYTEAVLNETWITVHPYYRELYLPKTRGSFTGSGAVIGELKYHVFIFKPYDAISGFYQTICAGSIITTTRVLTSAHCLLTNRKRPKYTFSKLRVVAGILNTFSNESHENDEQQWRRIHKLFTQKYYRFPYYNLAVLEVDQPWIYSYAVHEIPFAKLDQDFNGYCTGVAVKAVKSWRLDKNLHSEQLHLIPRKRCENRFVRNMYLFVCTEYDTDIALAHQDVEGGGLICRGTGDPMETDIAKGVLVGVHAAMNFRLPTLHTKVALFHQWITDSACLMSCEIILLFINILLVVL